jgi:ankyrin repeat protein
MAAFRGQRDAVRMLLENGADPNLRGDEGDSPLRWCAEHDDLETAALLLKHGADKTINESGGGCGCTGARKGGDVVERSYD